MWLLGASQFLFLGQKWIKMAQPFTRCPGPTYLSVPWWKGTWDRGMTQSTLGHHLEPCSLEQWTQVMCLKGAKTLSTKHKAPTMWWQIYTAKKLHLEKLRSEIKNSPVDIAPSRCSPISVPWTKWIKMAQPFTTCPGPTYLSMPWWKGHLRPWNDPKHTWTPPRTMLLGTVNPSHVPEGCQNTEHKTQSTYHGMANLHCKKLHLEKLRSEIKNSPVDVAPRC